MINPSYQKREDVESTFNVTDKLKSFVEENKEAISNISNCTLKMEQNMWTMLENIGKIKQRQQLTLEKKYEEEYYRARKEYDE
jgi:hypothetical protein